MSERPSCSGDGAVAYIGVWSMNSFLDSETLREEEKREGDPKQGFRIRPLFSADAKGVESGVKGRQIRRPFLWHYD